MLESRMDLCSVAARKILSTAQSQLGMVSEARKYRQSEYFLASSLYGQCLSRAVSLWKHKASRIFT